MAAGDLYRTEVATVTDDEYIPINNSAHFPGRLLWGVLFLPRTIHEMAIYFLCRWYS